MRVSGNSGGVGVSRSLGDGKAAASPQPQTTPAPAAAEDALVVSTTSQYIAIAQAQILDIPDVRMDKVEALKALMDADDYNPDPEAVAEGLVREHTPAQRE